MLTSTQRFALGRIARDIKALVGYPVWLLQGSPAPDNHTYKKRRIHKIARLYGCDTFIETGTFYGQMVHFAKSKFRSVISIEIYKPFFEQNVALFERDKNVHIIVGDSSVALSQAFSLSTGKILFWLDGHYSGDGTGRGDKISPIIEELRLIAGLGQPESCIIIDDRRLFTGIDGYPTMDETTRELLAINPDYAITFDSDCIIAAPR